MKKHIYIFVAFLVLSFCFYSCDTDKNRCMKSTGEIKSEKFNLESFSKVQIKSDFDITLISGDEYSLIINCGENLIPYINREIKGNELILENKNTCEWLRKREKPKLTITCPNLKEITIYETCDLKSLDSLYFTTLSIQNWAGIFTTDMILSGDSLFFRSHASTGDYKLEGRCNYAYIYNVGNGYLKARKLFCNYIHAVHKSLGDSEVNPSKRLFIEEIKYGKLYSFGTECPEIISDADEGWEKLFENIGCGGS
ncbi:MAG: hypothetical protein GX793_01350 [Bacteroidales bacterium]|jgi:hypothetical protein|nr:DUF2807 domain-containing protein [Bacteroidales bacterium]MDY0315037.1 DUF2807 domain-containing protein [Bacteroidales bacterium]NLB85684.1 hypothetical protein [Bacteroidales bacterium]